MIGRCVWEGCDRFAVHCPDHESGHRRAEKLTAEVVKLKRLIRKVRRIVEPLIDYEMGENSRGENSDPLRAVLPLLDLRKKRRR